MRPVNNIRGVTNFIGCLRKVEYRADTLRLSLLELAKANNPLVTMSGSLHFTCSDGIGGSEYYKGADNNNYNNNNRIIDPSSSGSLTSSGRLKDYNGNNKISGTENKMDNKYGRKHYSNTLVSSFQGETFLVSILY